MIPGIYFDFDFENVTLFHSLSQPSNPSLGTDTREIDHFRAHSGQAQAQNWDHFQNADTFTHRI